MKRHTLEQIVNKAAEIYKIPTLGFCNIDLIGTNRLAIDTDWNQLDLDRNEQTKFSRRYLFDINADKKTLNLLDVSKPNLIRTDFWRTKSNNNSLTATISNWKDKTDDKQFLEIWNNDAKINNINLTKLNKHDKLYDNTIAWSSNSTKLAYIAEIKKTRKVASFFTSNVSNSEGDDYVNAANHEDKYANDYVNEWGEQNVGKSQSVLAIFDLNSLELKVVENIPKDICPASLAWYKDEGVVFSGLYTKPYRLGLVYCPTRKSDLFYYDLNQDKCIQLTDSNESLREPRFSYDYKSLCWLQNPANGPHLRCSQLIVMDWDTKKSTVIVDIVREESKNGDFNGIFTQNLLRNCWSLDNKRIILSTQTSHKTRVISCDVDNKSVTVLDSGLNDLNYCEALAIQDDWICALLQGYNKKPTVIVAKLPDRGSEKQIKWNLTDNKQDELELLAQVDLLQFEPTYVNMKYPKVKFEAILVQKKQTSDVLVVFPHGGPHSSYQCEYSPHVAIFYSLGYSVLMVNYRGSSGYGQDNIDSLPGDIGFQDVKDTQQAAEFCKNQFNFKKVVAYGGSHGGFLSSHLIGQYPDFYAAASVRNPVIDLETMRVLTDIPDWIYTEAFGHYEFDYKYVINKDEYEELINKSPIKYLDSVKTPILLLVGSVDLRVPIAQSIDYYKGLIARNKTARLVLYKEDNHPLSKPQTTADCIVNTILWYEKYLE